ncbi:MAG TPA: enoyl-CoA hydratase/isomerase family protein [Beijerinckiaceae bacterium]|nr:enoyl-CoA hydratase/isomerase family protein [Beijerinckiaceae bacterium]
MTSEAEILIRREGAAGVMILNRPKALNALTHDMVRQISAALTQWERDPAVTRVVIKGAGERAFCAGGDIRVVHDLGRAGRHAEALEFWRDEYVMNRQIKRYPKPYIALIDGIVMGGGVGVSLHGSHRVAGERYNFAMPEVGIGFFPDVGGTYALPRLPFHSGSYLALTGQRIGRADAIALGLATHAVAGSDFAALEAELIAGGPVDATLARFAAPAEPAPILEHRDEIAQIFALETVPAVLAALERLAPTSAYARATLATIRAKSPTSVALALEQMLRGVSLSFEDAMTLEMRIVTRIIHGEDFYEGVRAAILDKDQAPRWQPDRLEAIDPAAIQRYFAPLPDDLTFPAA